MAKKTVKEIGDLPQIEMVDIHTVQTNPNNPRIIKDAKFKKLVKSIQDFPEMLKLRPVVVDENLIALGGNMRHSAAIAAGLTEIPIIRAADLSEKQQKEFIIKDNVGFGEWDFDVLANEWEREDLEDWGVDLPKFDSDTNEPEDLSGSLQPMFKIEIEFKDEAEQMAAYNKFIEGGYECRILTL